MDVDIATTAIAILLATYNGENYLEEQIHSLFNQSYGHFHIFIRDDGSSDKTLSILKNLANQYPQKITLLATGKPLGASGNFSELMGYVKNYQYVMFCDQDDVWETDKIALTFAKMKELENQHGKALPLLVHTDLKVVNAKLQVLDHSFWNYSCLYPQYTHSLNRLITQNVVTGCAMMINNALLNRSHPIPSEAIMHDWWIAITASAFGKIEIVKTPTIFYRQHSKNTLGAQNFLSFTTFKKGIDLLLKKQAHEIPQRYLQAKKFLERYQAQFSVQQQELLCEFISQPHNGWLKKRYTILKYRFFKNGLLRNLAQLLFGIIG